MARATSNFCVSCYCTIWLELLAIVVFHATVLYGLSYEQCLCFMLFYCIAGATSNVCVSCCSTIYLEPLAMFMYHAAVPYGLSY